MTNNDVENLEGGLMGLQSTLVIADTLGTSFSV